MFVSIYKFLVSLSVDQHTYHPIVQLIVGTATYCASLKLSLESPFLLYLQILHLSNTGKHRVPQLAPTPHYSAPLVALPPVRLGGSSRGT